MNSYGRNFDDIAEHFQKKIYGSSKGKIRLHRLRSDLKAYFPELYSTSVRLNVLDAGGGLGQLAVELAFTNDVILSDVSSEMLALAKKSVMAMPNRPVMRFEHAAIQVLDARFGVASQDVVLCHAVLEWVDDPRMRLQDLVRLLKPGGFLSLATYNKSATFFRNLINGNFKWVDARLAEGPVLEGAWQTEGQSLTPPNPLMPDVVAAWLQEMNCVVMKRTGIRVFDDYRHHMLTQKHTEDDILNKEEFFGVREPYSRLGRYNHFLIKKL